MTQIVDKIKAIELNERSISQWVDIKSTFSVANDSFGTRIDTLYNYDIGIKLGARVVVDHLHNSDHIGSMVTNVKRAVIEELYGEFRKPLIELEIVIAEGRQQEALKKVRNMHRTMFGLEG
jgi:hypothetical protein